jgi:pimeloyl-ACP methyl ester carboxylesterase
MKPALMVRPFIKIGLAFIFTGSAFGCNSSAEKREINSVQLPKSGVVHDRMVAITNKDLSYALYLPSGLNGDGMLYPVILALDPGGSGLTPVKKYKELAEKYGYILMGSNDSHNGQPTTEIGPVITGMLGEIRSVYPCDSNRIYLAGFSGGSRVAGMAATYYEGVKGVIGCGAGFPTEDKTHLAAFDYFGIAGTADFNMNEMIQLDRILEQVGMRHFITTFPGPHAWPPAGVMEDGFQWCTLNAMKDGTLKRDDVVIGRIMAGFDIRIAKERYDNQLIPAAQICKEAILFGEGLISTDKFKKELQSISDLPEYKNQVAYRQKILKKEAIEQQSLMEGLFSKDEAWWKARIDKMNSKPMQNCNPEDTLMNARLKAFLSLVCYSNADAAIKQRNREVAKTVITVYEMADPQNPEPNYMRAVILLQRYDSTAAVKQLGIAISKGFSDKIRMMQQPEFQGLKNSPDYFDLLQKMK